MRTGSDDVWEVQRTWSPNNRHHNQCISYESAFPWNMKIFSPSWTQCFMDIRCVVLWNMQRSGAATDIVYCKVDAKWPSVYEAVACFTQQCNCTFILHTLSPPQGASNNSMEEFMSVWGTSSKIGEQRLTKRLLHYRQQYYKGRQFYGQSLSSLYFSAFIPAQFHSSYSVVCYSILYYNLICF